MANKEIHELITAEELSASDVIAEQRNNSGTWLTRKLTFNALGLFLLNKLDYATELHTTSKKIIGAINELKDGVSAVSIGTTAPSDSQGDNRNLYIQYDATDYSVVAMYVKIEDSWRPIELGGGGSFVELTQAEYDALEQAGELEEDVPYYITDVNGDGSQFQPVIYSTIEREIGVWLDGKPLYEITLETDTQVQLNNTSWTTIPWNNEPSDIDFLVSAEIVRMCPNTNSTMRFTLDGGHIKGASLVAGDYPAVSNLTERLVIRYTKSTDTAGSGTWTPQGVPAVHYSTDERIVGTWIDGSTLYEKSFSVTSPVENVPTNIIEITSLSVDDVVSLEGVINAVSNAIYIGNTDWRMWTRMNWESTNKDYIACNITNTAYASQPLVVTIRYTKSST